jgi:hypothetical protein
MRNTAPIPGCALRFLAMSTEIKKLAARIEPTKPWRTPS